MANVLTAEQQTAWQHLCKEGGSSDYCNPVHAELEASGSIVATFDQSEWVVPNAYEFNGDCFSVDWTMDFPVNGETEMTTLAAEASVLIERPVNH